MTRIVRSLPALLALALCACASLTKQVPFTTYAPRYTAPSAATTGTPVRWQLAVDTPLASDALDTARMLVMPTPGAIETYKNARWSDTAPLLLRSLVVQAFQQSGRITGVGASTSGLHADYSLAIDLYDFETQYQAGAPRAVIRLNARLSDLSVNRIVAARAFEAQAPVGGAQAGDAATAFEQALNELLPRMVGWTIEQGDAHWHPASANGGAG